MSIFFGLSVSIFTALKNKVKGLRYWFLFLCPIAAAMTIMGANSRGAQLALAVQLLIIFKSKLSLKRVFWSLLVAILIYSFFPAQQLERFRSIGEDDTSQQRILYWENGLDMLHDHPMTGVGYFNYPLYYNTFYSQDLVGMRARKGAELPHNIFVQVGAELGFFGLLIYVALILQGISINARQKKLLLSAGKAMHWAFHMAIGLNVGLVGFFIAGQFVSVVYYPFFWISLALSVALGNILSSLK
jgi:O-antigen ligase